MPATGSKKPLVYMLGEAPGELEDERGKQFVGPSGQILRARIPEDWSPHIRWNNVVRTKPPKNRTPEFLEIESCRPSVIKDIEESKPVAIFGFGNIPLEWVSGYSGIYKWRGRRMPVKVGKHTCWFYPMLHPSGILRKRKYEMSPTKIGSEDERAFVFDLKRAFREVDEGLPDPVVHDRKVAESNVEMVTTFTDADVTRILEKLRWFCRQKAVGLDYETNGLRPYNKKMKILTIAIAAKSYTLAFPLHHRKAKWTDEQKKRIWDAFMEFLFATPVKKIVHNLAFEMEWSAVKGDKGVLRSSNWECTMQQAVVLDERVGGKGGGGCLSLDFLVQQYFGFALKALSKLDRKRLNEEPLESVLLYNGMDAKYHRGLFFQQRARLDDEGLPSSYQRSLRRVPTCVLTQIKGVPRDPKAAEDLNVKYEKRINKIEKEISGLKSVGRWEARYRKKFNPMSDDQCVLMFRDVLGYKEGFNKKPEERDSGFVRNHKSEATYNTDKNVLQAIGTRLALLIIELRESTKRKNTYLRPLLDGQPEVYDDAMLHPTLNTAFSEPGRTSSEGPNVQNFPKRDGEAKEVRKGIRAPEGQIFVALDQGQIQARIIGMASKDKTFCKSLWEKYDVHMEWAQRIAKVYPRIMDRYTDTPTDPMKAFRGDVKNQWTFPLFFGAQIKSVAEYLHIPENVAETIVTEFWNQFSGVADWHERLRKFYYQHGYVELLTGRRVRAPLSFNEMINYPIQGTEAEIVLDCHSRISEMESNLWDHSLDRINMPKKFQRLSNAGNLLFQPTLMIHDDLTFCLPKHNYMDYVEYIVPEMLKKTFNFINVPLQVELSTGEVWYDMKEQEKFYSEKMFRPGEGGW